MRKVLGAIVLIIGTFVFLTGIFPVSMMTKRFDLESAIFTIIFAGFGLAVILGGVVLWGWKRKLMTLGIVSIMVGGLLFLPTIGILLYISKSPEVRNRMPEMATLRILVIGSIFIAAGIYSIFRQNKIDKK